MLILKCIIITIIIIIIVNIINVVVVAVVVVLHLRYMDEWANRIHKAEI